MVDFVYTVLLKLLYPTSIALLLLLASAAAARRRPKMARWYFWLAVAAIMICGNGWIVAGMTRHLERLHLTPTPLPSADVIVVLSGGIWAKQPPRSTVEIGEAGDRLLYGCYLYRQKKAPAIVCTGGIATKGIEVRPWAEEMKELLLTIGVPSEAIILEAGSGNTREHARNLAPMFEKRGDKRVLLVTSAIHMPRSLGVFKKACPRIEFIPAPTDFRVTEHPPSRWYRHLVTIVPTPGQLQVFCEVSHEYLGLFYYWLRGWI